MRVPLQSSVAWEAEDEQRKSPTNSVTPENERMASVCARQTKSASEKRSISCLRHQQLCANTILIRTERTAALLNQASTSIECRQSLAVPGLSSPSGPWSLPSRASAPNGAPRMSSTSPTNARAPAGDPMSTVDGSNASGILRWRQASER